MLLLFFLAHLIWFSSSNAAAAHADSSPQTNDPLTIYHDDGQDARTAEGFGVGIDLCASYGALVLSGPGGFPSTRIKIDGDDGYIEVMKRLSLDSSRHLSPPYQNIGDSLRDEPRQALRSSRKAMGLPASKDVGHLADMLIALRDKVQKHLPAIQTVTGITLPHSPAIYAEDVRDACEYAKLDYIVFPHRYPHEFMYETAAAYAGYGFGLCDDYTDQKRCRRQELDMEFDPVMTILYTNDILTVSISVLRSAYYLRENGPRYYSSIDLGYASIRDHDDSMVYWHKVEDFLRRPFGQTNVYNIPSKVLLTGDHVNESGFRSALNNVLQSELDTKIEIYNQHAEAVAAKGAAELTKRLLWTNSHDLLKEEL